MVQFSKCVQEMRTSEIRDLMKLATDPNIISFAGGMPNNDLFPIAEVDEIYNTMGDELKKVGFQYGPTPGYPPLIESLKIYLKKKGLPVDTNELIITTGSLQAINIVTKLFCDPGDTVLTEDPCFIGGTSAFKSYQANIASVPMDADGIIMEELERKYEEVKDNAKMLYLSPYFHNPAGIVYSKERKKDVMNFLKGKDLVLMEDDPYGELYFDEKDVELLRPMKADETGEFPICYTGSFSKIFGPGIRLGWLLANPEIINKAQLAKQSIDACSSTLNQVIADQFMRAGKLEPYVANLRKIYARRMNIMLNAMNDFMPETAKWVVPKGGFYIWITLPEHVDTLEILKESIPQGAVFVIGKTFDPHGKKNNSFRLAFSHTPEDQIAKGVEIIAKAVRKFV